EVFDVDRGGDVTYHGPGQLVGYPIIRLVDFREDLGWYMRAIEELIIRTLRDFDVDGTRKEGMSGVWCADKKVCAIGVRASRWVTMHGFAFNITTDLDRFEAIVPCGITDYAVTSIEQQASARHSLEDVALKVASHWDAVFTP
ncbi:MAG: lipoyl(octanoyl) transferase LipB, partial [bacterium]|nr:lipoyl(octanoyl) transferase LipB [Candidatus Kapabacteria bacterium]